MERQQGRNEEADEGAFASPPPPPSFTLQTISKRGDVFGHGAAFPSLALGKDGATATAGTEVVALWISASLFSQHVPETTRNIIWRDQLMTIGADADSDSTRERNTSEQQHNAESPWLAAASGDKKKKRVTQRRVSITSEQLDEKNKASPVLAGSVGGGGKMGKKKTKEKDADRRAVYSHTRHTFLPLNSRFDRGGEMRAFLLVVNGFKTDELRRR